MIARQQINPSVNADTFSIQHILNIAEINLTTDAIADVVDRLKEYDITPLKGEDIRPDALTFMGNYEKEVPHYYLAQVNVFGISLRVKRLSALFK
ncbi:hypothetical protein LSPH24S_04387 [Lysinibacillus sphaericus]